MADDTGDDITVFMMIDDAVSDDLRAAVWEPCSSKNWYFGSDSTSQHPIRFWRMDLEDNEPVARFWTEIRPRCEEIASTALEPIRIYANGHTYGLGGCPHVDDNRPGTYTRLYYPMPTWPAEWEGETIFQKTTMGISTAVLPVPNRAILFDSRMAHHGRAPSRICTALRVTLAFKLNAA